MKVAAVFAHPDDIELSCGGTLALHARCGDEVYAINLTSGDIGGDSATREKEGLEGLNALGIKNVEYYRQRDGGLLISPSLISRLRDFILSKGINTVYTSHYNDTHQDHRATNEIVIAAVRRYPLNVLLCELPSTRDFAPNVYVDIKDTFEQKCKAISQHASQLARESFYLEDILTTAQYHARWAGLLLAEGFMSYRMVCSQTLTPHLYKTADQS